MNVEEVLSHLLEAQASLRKKEATLRSKIEVENQEKEKASLRRNFYKKLQANIAPKRAEATEKLEAAEQTLAALKSETEEAESQRKKLQFELDTLKAQNEADVLPELDRLGKLLAASNDEVAATKKAIANDEQRALELSSLAEAYNIECDGIRHMIDERHSILIELPQPESFADELASTEESVRAIQEEACNITQRKKEILNEICLQNQRTSELEKLKAAEDESLNQQLSNLTRQRQEYDDNVKALGEEKVKQHSLACIRVEIELNQATVEDGIKHETNFLNSVDKRQINVAKQTLAKKEQVNAKIQQLIPQLKAKLSDLQCQRSVIETEKSSLEREQAELRSKVDKAISNLLEQENIDESLQEQVDEALKLVAEQECEVERWRLEEKKAATISRITKEKCSGIRRKIEQAQQTHHDIESSIRLQQLIDIDLSKKKSDFVSKSNELTKLSAMIEAEKIETSRLIQTLLPIKSKQAIVNCHLKEQLRTLALERDEKMNTLRLLRKDIEDSSQTRASYRRDKSIGWSSCRMLLEEISNEETRMEKLRSILNLTCKEVERIKSKNQQMLSTKQSLKDQLAAEKAQLLSLFNSNSIYRETLKKGESICQQIKDEKKVVDLKNNDIKRSIDIVKSEYRDQATIEEQIKRAAKNLELQVLETERIAATLESPNQDRIRTLEGHDPSEEELKQNLFALESLERNNRDMIRSKVTAIKEITKRCKDLQQESNDWKISTQTFINDINDIQSRLAELKRIRTSQMSELQMYASLTEKLAASKSDLEHDISLRVNLSREPGRESRAYYASQTKKQGKEQRPTAYLPSGDEETTIRVPRPFGKMAPFQAIEPGSNMRHIRKPQPVPLIRPN